ncbi:MAG TPA: AlkA N-terminal domain-containing protein, partial [Geminicoccaceae bacterium]|nr:AlkA N-terminal domain-containing protein [Geminicoccaceae bacterium]
AAAAGHEAGAVLRLPYREPFPWESVLAFLAARVIPGVEAVGGGTYRRTVRVGPATGAVEVERPPRTGWLLARVALSDLGQLAALRGRLRRLFDLDADPAAIDPVLARDPLLAADVAARPGQRVPGAWDGIEIGVRAILGQQISVAGARTLAGRIAARWGEPAGDGGLARLFPTAAALAEADLAAVGVMPARARAVRALARALAAEPDLLAPHRPHGETVRRLEALPGIGPWTAQYIALRALRDPDAFPAADLGLLRAAAGAPGRPLTPRRLLERAEAWRPWRAYAAARLWTMATPAKAKEIEPRRPEPEPATAAVGA